MADSSVGPRWDFSMTTEERRAEIMKSLGDTLRERSISSLTMQDVADKLGMTKGNLYHYFNSKQDLLYQCHMKGMADSLRMLDDVREAGGSPTERLKTLMERLVRSVTLDPYGSVLITALENVSDEQRTHYLAHRSQFETGVQALIEEGVATGEFAPIDPKIASFALLGALNSISRWYRADGPRSPGYIADVFTGLLLQGLAARPEAAP
jgi:AcrR family transcriptional regulator